MNKTIKRLSRLKGWASHTFEPYSGTQVLIYDAHRDRTFYHSGDYGDIIYALPTIRALGGGKLFLGPEIKLGPKVSTRQTMSAKTVEMMRDLLEMQNYIAGVEFSKRMPDIDFDLNKFREEIIVEEERFHKGHERLNLAQFHLKRFKLPLQECDGAWLVVDRAVRIKGRPVLIHRSPRWLNPSFPWNQVLETYKDQIMFVGIQEEHETFCREWGSVPFTPTKTFLELARLIAGCKLFVGNQSLPYSICEGLKKTSLLEVWPEGPNCLFKRPNASYGMGRHVHVPRLKETMQHEKLLDCPMCSAPSNEATPFRTKGDIVKCQDCGVVYLRTRLTADCMVQLYQKYADGDSHMRIPEKVTEVRSSGLRRDYFLQEILKYVKVTTSTQAPRMLDIGCGWGAFLQNARDRGFDVFGTEICQKMADFGSSFLGIPIETKQVEDTCLMQGKFYDVVVALHSFEHLPYPAHALKHVHSMLRPGGLFCGIVPNIESYCSRKLKDEWFWLDPNMHYVHWSPDSLKKQLSTFGFDLIQLTTETGDYDARALAELVQKNADRPLSDEEIEEQITGIKDSGQGEEIRFFAQKL